MTSTRQVNMLEGSILSALTRLALPIMLASLVQMAYNFIDTLWIGRLGYQSVAAVGTAGMFIWFGEGLLMLARIGGQVYLGQSLGRKDEAEAKAWVASSFHLVGLLALLYGLLQYVFAPQLIAFFQFSEQTTIDQAVAYLRAYSLGYPFAYLARHLTGLVTACGQSRISLHATVTGLVLNMVLDPLLIFTLGWGATGAALATVLAQMLVVAVFGLALRREPLFRHLPLRHLEPARLRQLLRLGLPPALQTMFYASIAMVLGRLIASFGDAAISIQKVGVQIESLSWMTAEGFGVALTAVMAQNYGAGAWKRTRESFTQAFLLMGGLGLLTTALLYFFPGPIFRLFIQDAGVVQGGIAYLQILALSQAFMCLEIMTAAAFAGVGRTLLPSIVITLLTALRIPLAYLLARGPLGLEGVWWAISGMSIAKGVLLVACFLYFLKRHHLPLESEGILEVS